MLMLPFATFFKIAGSILIASGVLMLLVRPRAARTARGGLPDRGVLWAGFCMALGIAVVLMGAGVLPGLPTPAR